MPCRSDSPQPSGCWAPAHHRTSAPYAPPGRSRRTAPTPTTTPTLQGAPTSAGPPPARSESSSSCAGLLSRDRFRQLYGRATSTASRQTPVTWSPDGLLRLSDQYASEALNVATADLSRMASQSQGLSDVAF